MKTFKRKSLLSHLSYIPMLFIESYHADLHPLHALKQLKTMVKLCKMGVLLLLGL